MQRYFIPEHDWNSDKVFITEDNAHHIIRVMRKKIGDEIICNHPNGEAAICTITQLTKAEVHTKITKWLEDNAELPVQVTIAQGLPKGNKLELIFQKGTELGADEFWLFQADRSIAKWEQKKAVQKIKRYEKIIKEASEQCHRNIVPNLKETGTIEELLEDSRHYHLRLFAYEEEARTNAYSLLSDALQTGKPNDKIIVFIGPEGGFSNEEVELLKANKCKPVRLGRRILRTETASMYLLASISYHFEELRCKE